jgi:uncharacterized protein YjbI with pentapeptide repeats
MRRSKQTVRHERKWCAFERKGVPLFDRLRMNASSGRERSILAPFATITSDGRFTMRIGEILPAIGEGGRRRNAPRHIMAVALAWSLPMSRVLRCACLLIFWGAMPVLAADLTRAEVSAALTAATPERPADLAGKSLEGLDLGDLDFRRAKLAGVNLYGAKLVGADLTGVDLSGATLNLAWIMRANFTGADLSKASLQGLVVSSGLEIDLAEAPSFKGAKFTGARIIARFSRFDLSGADFSHAMMGADMKNQSMGLMRTDFSGANLAGANFAAADLGRASLRFANLTGANLAGAKLTGADLSGADLTGADLSNADAGDADFGNAILKDAKGLATVRGLALTRPGG